MALKHAWAITSCMRGVRQPPIRANRRCKRLAWLWARKYQLNCQSENRVSFSEPSTSTFLPVSAGSVSCALTVSRFARGNPTTHNPTPEAHNLSIAHNQLQPRLSRLRKVRSDNFQASERS